MKRVKLILSAGILISCTTSCMSVKGYQKMYLNDEEMELAARKLDFFETNFQTRGLELKLRLRESGENKTKLSLLSLSLSFNFESLSILYGSSEVHLFIPEKVHAKKVFLPSILTLLVQKKIRNLSAENLALASVELPPPGSLRIFSPVGKYLFLGTIARIRIASSGSCSSRVCKRTFHIAT